VCRTSPPTVRSRAPARSRCGCPERGATARGLTVREPALRFTADRSPDVPSIGQQGGRRGSTSWLSGASGRRGGRRRSEPRQGISGEAAEGHHPW
jgi:hypothetical protein